MNPVVVSIFVVIGIVGFINTLIGTLYAASKTSVQPVGKPVSERGNILLLIIIVLAFIVAVVVLKTGLESITAVNGVLP